MALSRKFLSAMGIEADKIDEIITAHTETVDALKDERDRYKADAEKLPDVQKDLDEANKKLEEASKADEKDKWKVKYDALKEEHDQYKAGVESEKTKQKKNDAYRELLKETGVSEKRLAAVLRVTDLDKLEFGEDGKLKDMDDLKKSIKEEWAEFIMQPNEQGAQTDHQNNPNGNGGNNGGGNAPSMAKQAAAKYYDMLYGTSTKSEGNK